MNESDFVFSMWPSANSQRPCDNLILDSCVNLLTKDVSPKKPLLLSVTSRNLTSSFTR